LRSRKAVRPQLDKCGPKQPNLCISTQPALRIGGIGIAEPAFIANPDYRNYVFKTIKAVSVDMETAAFAHVAYANKIPFIAFRSLSYLAGGDDSTEVGAFFGSGLAESNEANVILGFLEAWSKKRRNLDE
jgi:adenosylhomocysteine nucleosidase